MVALSKGRLLSPLSLHSGDVASSHISLRCGCEGDPSRGVNAQKVKSTQCSF